MLHKTVHERYQKLKNTFTRLKANFNRDDLDDFVQTANSLRDWIRNDATLSADQKAHLERFVAPESLDWQICHQIANQQKHARHANPRTRKSGKPVSVVVKGVQVKDHGTGFRVPPSMRTVGAGEEITIDCNGQSESALAFVIRVFRHFHYIFEVAPIPLDRRAPLATLDDILR